LGGYLIALSINTSEYFTYVRVVATSIRIDAMHGAVMRRLSDASPLLIKLASCISPMIVAMSRIVLSTAMYFCGSRRRG